MNSDDIIELKLAIDPQIIKYRNLTRLKAEGLPRVL